MGAGGGLTPRPLVPDDSSSESGSGNGSSTLNPSTSSSTQGDPAFPEVNGNGAVAPVDFAASAEDQPINLCDKLPQGSALSTPSYPSEGCGADGLRSRVKYGVKTTPEVCGAAGSPQLCAAATPVRTAGLCQADVKSHVTRGYGHRQWRQDGGRGPCGIICLGRP